MKASSPVNMEDSNDVQISPHKPDLILGVSLYNKPISDEDKRVIDMRFSMGESKRCEFCGAALHEEIRHPLKVGKAWFNACGMCYYASNLDLIPSFRNGKVIYFPFMSQPRFNAMLRCVWAMNSLAALDPDNDELKMMADSMEDIGSILKSQVEMTDAYFNNTDTEVYVSTMGLLEEHEYHQRHKLLQNFRWMPEQKVFEDDMAFWVEQDLSFLHPDRVSQYLKDFVTRYSPKFKLKSD